MVDMSQQKEERARQKFSDKMRQKSLAAKNAKLALKKEPQEATPVPAPNGNKKD
jgi:hypothetical protein